MQTNKLKSGRSGTNPIIREKLISLPAATDATVSFLPPRSLVQGQWVKKLANKIRKFNYSSAVPFQEVGCHTFLSVFRMCCLWWAPPPALLQSYSSPYLHSGQWTQMLSFVGLGGLDIKIKRDSGKENIIIPSFPLVCWATFGSYPKRSIPKA